MSLDPETKSLLPEAADAPDLNQQRHGWQTGVERLLLYLKCLQVTPEEQLGLALEAVRRARRRSHYAAPEPVSACLEALWQILDERCPATPGVVSDISRCSASTWERVGLRASFNIAQAASPLAHPPLRRQCMLSAPMELAPWRLTLQRRADAVRALGEKIFYRTGILLQGLIIILALMALK